MRRYFKTGVGPILNKRIEIAAVDRSGREFPVELTITPIFTRRPVCFYAFLRDISERKSAEAERSRLLRELEQAVRRRDEFISMASHELKTPLTSLRLQFQIAARQIAKGDSRVYSEESLNRRIDITNRQLDRMTKLIEDMLDVSRVTAGRLEMRLERDDLSQVVREAADDFRDSLLLGGHTIVAELEPGLFADFDRYRMEQVLLNLLTNAFKYGAGSPVKLTLKKVGGRARLTVEDQGPGIPESEFGRIFQRFERAASQNEVTGLGLGLFISRYIVEGHRGKIWVESEIGRGSRFIVELPLAR
jgi:signal transduction histidine kinase